MKGGKIRRKTFEIPCIIEFEDNRLENFQAHCLQIRLYRVVRSFFIHLKKEEEEEEENPLKHPV